MRIGFGCELTYDLPQPTPMIVMLNVHYSRGGSLERPDLLTTDPRSRSRATATASAIGAAGSWRRPGA